MSRLPTFGRNCRSSFASLEHEPPNWLLAKVLYSVLTVVVLASGGTAAEAAVGKLGIIGDSISQATHADDDCGALDTYECLEVKLDRPDPGYSFAGGDQSWSLRNVLGHDGLVDASRNGAKWRDAPQQARDIMLDADVRAVLVHMGSNDVCHPLDGTPPTLENLEANIDATLGHLTDKLPPGGVVFVAGLVDIVQLRDLMAQRDRHEVFENCQALWDLDFSRVKDSAIEDVCAHFFGSGCSSSVPSFFLERSYRALAFLYDSLGDASVLGVEGSCGNILNSESGPFDRQMARSFNVALNELMRRKANAYAGRNGVRVQFLGGLYEEQLLVEDVSTLDCFHPSRSGQRHIAEVLGLPILTRRRAIQQLPIILDLLDSN